MEKMIHHTYISVMRVTFSSRVIKPEYHFRFYDINSLAITGSLYSSFYRSVNLPEFIYIQFVSVFEMVNYCFVLPYLPGGAELAKKFAQENGHGKEHDDFYRTAGYLP
jgi:hypothetical protein